MKKQKIIKAKNHDLYEPYYYSQIVLLDCPECNEEYEWVSPFTVSGIDHSEEPDLNNTCRFHPSTPQRRCIKCQVKLRLKQAKEIHEN